MDRLFFASVVAQERRDEISNELAVRHLLDEAEGNLPRVSRSKRLVLRLAPVVIVISLIALYLIG
jgi:hypothetical protein